MNATNDLFQMIAGTAPSAVAYHKFRAHEPDMFVKF